MGQNETFTIRQMIELTGLSEFTIRGWENRYKAFSPQRSDTGRREYDKKDIERALLIRELLKRGHKISKIASLSDLKLKSLFEQFEEIHQVFQNEIQNKSVAEALELMALQKWSDLSSLFKNIKYKEASAMVHRFFLPLLKELAVEIRAGLVSVAQEHILSSLLKEKIYSVLSDLESKKKFTHSGRKYRFVLATPEGDYHEIGLLLAHLLIRSSGFTSLYLGPNTPARDLAETALRFEATHLLVVSTVSKKNGARQELLSFVSDLQNKIGSQTQIMLAGSQVPHMSREENTNLVNIENFDELESHLQFLGVRT